MLPNERNSTQGTAAPRDFDQSMSARGQLGLRISTFIRTDSLTLTALQNHLYTRHFRSLPLPLACPNPHSLLTQFRALAVFSRRSPQRVARSSLPAAENLHSPGLLRCNKNVGGEP
jgi:hypothetical protein